MIKIIFVAIFVSLGASSCVFGQKLEKAKNIDGQNTQSTSKITNEESFVIGSQSFVLGEKDGKCVLSYKIVEENKELILNMNSSCRVVRDVKDKVLFYEYKDVKAKVGMIVGGIDGEKKDASGKDFGKEAQYLIVKNGSVSLSNGSQLVNESQKGVFFVQYGTDQKNFWLASHSAREQGN